jgi:outer membrane protein assembly factor BamD
MLRRLIRPSMLSAFRLSVAAALLVAPLLAFGLSACSSDKDELPYVERPPEKIYDEAAKAMDDKNYKQAAKLFDEVERQHPYSQWATKAQLMAAFAHYQDLKYDDAVVALDRYIQLHPGSDQVSYAYYLKALCYYEQIADVGRDQKITKQALDALNEVVRRFPTTEYARDAKLKIDLTTDHLAGKEMAIGRFYVSQQNYAAAIGRFRNVVDNYQTTTHTAEALHRLVECYLSVGLIGEAQRAAAILGHNFPGSDWYQDSYALLVSAGATPPSAGSHGGDVKAGDKTDSTSGDGKGSGSFWDSLF